ncbi:MAG: phospholipase D-like domain-containing protein [Bacteroidota bacterium]
MKDILEPYQLFDDPFRYYASMLDDIENAQKSIMLQTYRMRNDTIGVKFRDILTRKAKEGIKIRILLDSWGSGGLSENFFSEIIRAGGELRFFEKIIFNFDFFTRSHRRNHKKLLIVDDDITYIGSSNLTDYNLNWRELVLRIKGEISEVFKRVFNQDFRMHNRYVFDKVRFTRILKYRDFEIVRDVPSITLKRISKRYIQLIKQAREKILIETPYFLPGFLFRKALSDAAKRGVEVSIQIPKHSDVGLVDILRNKYLGPLYKSGVKFLYYIPHNLHAKCMLIDDKVFAIASANFDYRSFRYMHEISLVGRNPKIIIQMVDHMAKTIQNCEEFNYEVWKRRPRINKFFEWLLLPFRHLL